MPNLINITDLSVNVTTDDDNRPYAQVTLQFGPREVTFVIHQSLAYSDCLNVEIDGHFAEELALRVNLNDGLIFDSHASAKREAIPDAQDREPDLDDPDQDDEDQEGEGREHEDGDGCAIYFSNYQVHRNGDTEHTVDVSELEVGDTYQDPSLDPADKWWPVTDMDLTDDNVHVCSEPDDEEIQNSGPAAHQSVTTPDDKYPHER